MANDLKYFSLLEKIAKDVPASAHNRIVPRARLAACIVYRNEIVSFGINQLKSHPFQAKFSKNKEAIYLHAETNALTKARKRLTMDEFANSSLYVCRIKYSNTLRKHTVWGLSKPCDGCIRAAAAFNIKKVCYTCDDGGYEVLLRK